MIEISHLSKSFGKLKALSDITFRVEKGEVMGFLGENGAGKSTTMNILTGYLSQDAGTVKIDGIDLAENPKEAKHRIGYLPEKPPLYPNMTVDEYLSFVYDLKGITLPDKKKHLTEITDRCGLTDVRKRLIRNLSKGYKQRVGLAQALCGNPEVLVLDEPTVGLDPVQIIEIRELIRTLGREHTVILSSHILSEISAICEKVIIIHKGQIAAAAFTDKLIREFENVSHLHLVAECPADTVKKALSATLGVAEITAISDSDTLSELSVLTEGDLRQKVMERLTEKKIPLRSFCVDTPSLETIFLKYVGGEPDEGDLSQRA